MYLNVKYTAGAGGGAKVQHNEEGFYKLSQSSYHHKLNESIHVVALRLSDDRHSSWPHYHSQLSQFQPVFSFFPQSSQREMKLKLHSLKVQTDMKQS